MAVTFFHPYVLPHDASGWGRWLTEHYYEHIRFMLTLRSLVNPINVAEYDILSWSDEPGLVQGWLGSHEKIHEDLRAATGLTGSNLQDVDFKDDTQFLLWLDNHAQEHQQLQQILGAT